MNKIESASTCVHPRISNVLRVLAQNLGTERARNTSIRYPPIRGKKKEKRKKKEKGKRREVDLKIENHCGP